MTLNILCEVKPDFSFHYRELAKKVIEKALDAERFPCEAEISLTLTDNAGIREINARMRGIDAPTDVLSFPMIDYVSAGDFSEIGTQWEDTVNPDTGEVVLGDIVLSADRVRSQAEEYGHSEKREYAFLIVHSMLHLMGYDHEEPEDAEVMEERQRKILDALNIRR